MILTVLLLALCSFTHALSDPQASPQQVHHANHVFNAIHNSMRQFGSSLKHNGMSFFIATVPEDTQLYHGTNTTKPVTGTEWLAFEPEHALVFAFPNFVGIPGPRPSDHARAIQEEPKGPQRTLQQPAHQQPLHSVDSHHAEPEAATAKHYGYLHTYRTKHALRLLYIDGQSAAKSHNGTLDSQDLVLLHDNPPPSALFGEPARASGLCRLARERWHGRVHGFLRMEMGFEIILCAFADHLAVERVAAARTRYLGDAPHRSFLDDQVEWYRAIARRFDGIGGHRVRLHYDRFVTLFARPGAVSFDAEGQPRVKNDSALVAPVRAAIDEMAGREGEEEGAVDWQAVADMVVARYAGLIDFLSSSSVPDIETFKQKLESSLRSFIDIRTRDRAAEVQRCAKQFFPWKLEYAASLAPDAILEVTNKLCSTLSSAFETEDLDKARSMIQELKTWLSWTTWKRCEGCSRFETCFVSVWPYGTVEEIRKPKCISNFTDYLSSDWGGWGKPDSEFEWPSRKWRSLG